MFRQGGPFIKKVEEVPGDQVQRFGPSQELQMCLYDTFLHGAGQRLRSEEPIFATNARIGDEELTSMKKAGTLADLKQFVVYGMAISIYFRQLADPGSNGAPATEADAEELYYLFVFHTRYHFFVQNAEKQVLWGEQVPAGGGINGFNNTNGAATLNNGTPMSGAFYRLSDGAVITPQKTFRWVMRWITNVVSENGAPAVEDPRTRFNEAINSYKLGRAYWHGIEVRDWTNG